MLDTSHLGRSGWVNQSSYDLERCRTALSPHFSTAEAEHWLNQPHAMLHGRSAVACIEAGDTDRVMDAIRQIDTYRTRDLVFT